MKPWRTLLITILGLLVLAACSGSEDSELAVQTAGDDGTLDESTTVVETEMEEVEAEAEETEAEAEIVDDRPDPTQFVAQLDPNREYSETDLSLVGTSGQLQFLNSYADW